MFYSADVFDSPGSKYSKTNIFFKKKISHALDYHVGVARADDLFGPYERYVHPCAFNFFVTARDIRGKKPFRFERVGTAENTSYTPTTRDTTLVRQGEITDGLRTCDLFIVY